MKSSEQPLTLSRRHMIAGGVALGAAPLLLPRFLGTAGATTTAGKAGGVTDAFGFPEADMTSRIVRPMQFPVEGTVSWTDTYGACRDGCSRRHEGQDLLGRKLQKLVACVDGTVVGLKFGSAGNYLYLQDSAGWSYGYLHINNDTPGTDDGRNPRQWAFAPGIAVGSRVAKGDFIAYMGDSGNAEATVPHCHYEIRKPADAWYHGQAINPKYSLDAATSGGTSTVPSSTFAPWATSTAFISQQYLDFLNRRPRADELGLWRDRLDSGQVKPADLLTWITDAPGSVDVVAPILRLYWAYFSRLPDSSGLMYWIGKARAGTSSDKIAEIFSGSAESVRRYGPLSDAQYVDRVYRTILGKAPDAGGHAYWVRRLGNGTTRGRMMRYFVETDRYCYITSQRVRICTVYAGMLRRAPDASGFRYWDDHLTMGVPLQTMAATIQASAGYRGRFPAR